MPPLKCPFCGETVEHVLIDGIDRPTVAWCQACFRVRELAPEKNQSDEPVPAVRKIAAPAEPAIK